MSYSFQAYYALNPIQADTLTFIEEEYEVAPSEDDDLGGLCVDSDSILRQTIDTNLLRKLSEQSSAVYLAAFSSGDIFYFEYWQNGACQRTLEYESDSGWIAVTGQPELWEAATFFDRPSQISRYLNDLKDELGADSPEYLNTETLLSRVQENQAVESGAFLPGIDAELSAINVLQHYQIQLPFA